LIDKIISLCKGKKYDSYKEIKTNADFNDWFNKEDPHKGLTEVEKRTIPKVGTTLNNIIRKGNREDVAIKLYDNLTNRYVLQENLVVYRGVESVEYEEKLSRERNLNPNELFFDGFIYTSLFRENCYNHRQIEQKILIPKGSKYFFTGEYSNAPEVKELVLPRNCILRILNKEKKRGKIYMTLIVDKVE